MTDPTTPGVPETVPAAPASPGHYVDGAPKTPVFSIVALITGILGFLGGPIAFIPFVGWILALPLPIVAIIFGFLGRKREPHANKWFWNLGIVLGLIGLAAPIAGLIFWAIVFSGTPSYDVY